VTIGSGVFGWLRVKVCIFPYTLKVVLTTLTLPCECDYYLRQGKRSEHCRRLRDWSFCPSFISACHTQPTGTVAPSCENFYFLR